MMDIDPRDRVYSNTPTWYELRCGRPTGSRAGDITARKATVYSVCRMTDDGVREIVSNHRTEAAAEKAAQKKGGGAFVVETPGEPAADRDNYLLEKLTERLTGRVTEYFVTDAMKFGIEMEPRALAAYSAATGNMLERGYWVHKDTWGVTPDAFVIGGPIVVETKCRTPINHTRSILNAVMNGTVERGHYWQCIAYFVAMPGIQRVDLVYYHPYMLRADDQIVICKILRENHAEAIDRLSDEISRFIAELDEAERAWRSCNTIIIPPQDGAEAE